MPLESTSTNNSTRGPASMGFNIDRVLENPEILKAPWFQKAYQSALEFYEKDKVLDPKDRLDLSMMYSSIARTELLCGWGSLLVIVGIPMTRQYRKTGSIKGANLPRAFMLGFLSMFVSSQVGGSLAFKSKLNSIKPSTLEDDPNLPKSSQQKQYDMMKLLDVGMPSRWAKYFQMTYNNPARRIPDPKSIMEQLKSGKAELRKSSMVYDNRDPLGLYTGPQFDKVEGVPNAGVSTVTQAPQKPQDATYSDDYFDPFEEKKQEEPILSSWERIRRENGLANTNPGNSWEEIRKQNFESSEPKS